MMRALVGIADLLRVCRALGTEGRALETVARMFSLTVSPLPTLPPGPAVQPDIEVEDDLAEVSADPASFYVADAGDSTHVRWLQPVALEEPAAAPTTLSDPLPPRGPSQVQPPREYRALLDPHVAAELMVTAASTNVPTGEIDVDAAVEVLCRQRPLTELPRLHSLSVDTGVQVLVDVGESMEPFLRDQTEFLAELRRLVGAQIHVGFFADDPRTGTGPTRRRASWHRYELPETGQPVIVLSDLGFGMPRRETAIQAWRILSPRLRKRGNPVVVFAPLEPRRVPERLRQSLELVVWDRSTRRSRPAPSINMITKQDLQDAGEILAAYPAGSPLVRLAELLAPAALIEPELLRRMRLTCIPEADVMVEQALWFSELIRSRSDQGLALGTAVRLILRRRLQRRLAAQRDLVERARSVMETLHREQTPLLALEESLAWSEVFGDTDALRAAADTLINSLLAGRDGMEHWLTRTWDSLPAPLRHTPAGQSLAQVAAVHGADIEILPPQELDVARVLHLLPLVPVFLRRDVAKLHLGVPAADATHGIRVPDTRPAALDVLWQQDGSDHMEKVLLRSREARVMDVGSGTVSVRTLAGERYEIEPVAVEFVLEIEMLAAGPGQSLLLTYGKTDAPLHVLIDCGPAPTARAIQNRIGELPPDKRRLELLVLTHIDADRIGGAIRLLEDEKRTVEYRDIWFNGFRHLEQPGESRL